MLQPSRLSRRLVIPARKASGRELVRLETWFSGLDPGFLVGDLVKSQLCHADDNCKESATGELNECGNALQSVVPDDHDRKVQMHRHRFA